MNKTKAWQKKDRKYLWHPFTQMQDWMQEDMLIIERGQGNYLFDVQGRKYLDGVSSLWCNLHGHQKKAIDKAVKSQLSKIAHSTMLGLSHRPAIALAQQLIKIAPRGLSRVFYSDDGSTAMEIALKMAFQYWRQTRDKRQIIPTKVGTPLCSARNKTKFLTLSSAYHGDTIGSVSLGGVELFHDMYKPLLFRTIQAPAPYCYRCGFNPSDCGMRCLKGIERIMKKHHQELAALVIEPLMQAAGGMIIQPKGFLKRIRQLCTKYHILMIADEVATGFGRTGKMFACEHERVTPDIMALAKGITGGYLPLAATLTTEKIFRAFLGRHQDQKTFFHGHTYTGNPLACAAALANLKIFRRERVLERLQSKIRLLTRALPLFYLLKNVGNIRQCGFMVGIELVKDKKTGQPYPYGARMGHRVILEARKQGVILRPLGEVIVLMPPLSITLSELTYLLEVCYRSIKKVQL